MGCVASYHTDKMAITTCYQYANDFVLSIIDVLILKIIFNIVLSFITVTQMFVLGTAKVKEPTETLNS